MIPKKPQGDSRMGTGKKKIEIKIKEKEQDRLVAFSKRRKGLYKKAHQLHSLSGAQVAILVFSPAGKPYIYGVPCFDDVVDKFYDHDQGNFDEDFRDIDACMSWLGKMDFEACDDLKDLVSVKNDLETIRDKLVKRIGETSECVSV
ncbi:MADS-box transcription factor [Heracleum sosnowskyi]|uniref:MADS-box transcription factor n=1 Tax=Heracleum sosnowskyi TaxID=360622 RepID=A0AAD8GZD2_9APIA|nr:MADS-box transcription factor [Heracleum sosnowskyi]